MSQYDNGNNNDIDRLLQGAFDSRPRGAGGSPSMVDVRHRARRHQRRRVGGVVGATAMLGVSGVAVLASRGSSESGIAGDEATTTWVMTAAGQMCGYTRTNAFPPTTTESFENSTTITWLDTTLPPEATSNPPQYPPTTLYPSGCTPSGQFRCIGNTGMDEQGYTYFDYCEPANPGNSTFPYPTTTTTTVAPSTVGSILVVDASGGLAGAADDMVARFSNTGFGDVSLLEGTRTVPQTMLMPIGDGSALDIVRQLSGIDGFDTWSPDMIADQLPGGTLVVIVVGQDYWTREQLDPSTPPPTSTTDVVFDPSTTAHTATITLATTTT